MVEIPLIQFIYMHTQGLVIVIFSMLARYLLIPILFVYWTGFRKSKSKVNLALKLFTVWTCYIYLFYIGRWDFVSYFFRYFFLFLIAAASIKALVSFKDLPLFEKKNVWGWTKLSVQILLSILFFWTNVQVIKGFSVDVKGIDVSFPLKEGYIGHGGNSVIINYHHVSKSQRYAFDISKVNAWGARASGFVPDSLNKYAIYGDTIFSPCDGRIVKLVDGLDNVPPGIEDTINLAGNHIVLEYENNLIVMAHLLKHSLMVSAGDKVKKGQPLARVGNTGHTSEPHLHIHAISGTDTNQIIRGGHGIPIYFDGKFLVRNDRVVK